jgi:hypothetical protein
MEFAAGMQRDRRKLVGTPRFELGTPCTLKVKG